MDLFFIGVAFEPPKTPLIDIFKETKIEQKIEPELTVQEKIDLNYYNCDESTQYIRADNARCLAKPVYVPPKPQNPVRASVRGSSAPSGWYPWGQCTYWVWTQRSVGQWNNASEWAWQARRDGWTVSSTPVVGAIAQRGNHVAYVESVGGGNVVISEMNYTGLGVVNRRTVPVSYFTYIY